MDKDVVVFNGPDIFWAEDNIPSDAKKIMIAHNIECIAFRRQLENSGIFARIVLDGLLGDLRKLEKLEDAYFAASDAIIAISHADAAWITKRFPEKPVFIMPPSFDYAPQDRAKAKSGAIIRLGFLGKMGWWPNRDGVEWFLHEIFPAAPKSVEFHIFGMGSEKFSSPHNRVFGHGFVKDINKVWAGGDIFVCPIRTGGGANIKLAEALYNGAPVISTPFAANGLGLYPGSAANLKILGAADEWRQFLNSDGLADFAVTASDAALSNRFALEENAQKLSGWLRDQLDAKI